MIIFGFAAVGAAIGWFKARGRGGKGLDKAQYAASYAMAFGIIGLFVTVFVSRGA